MGFEKRWAWKPAAPDSRPRAVSTAPARKPKAAPPQKAPKPPKAERTPEPPKAEQTDVGLWDSPALNAALLTAIQQYQSEQRRQIGGFAPFYEEEEP
jgi:hypothetical protein